MNTILPVRAEAVQGWPERVLSACFQLLSRVMQAAAHLCGIAQQGIWSRSVGGLLGAESLGAPDLPTLIHSQLPLSEIAAAERERLTRLSSLADEAASSRASSYDARCTLH